MVCVLHDPLLRLLAQTEWHCDRYVKETDVTVWTAIGDMISTTAQLSGS